MQNSNNTDRSTMLRGSTWMTIGSILSRILGAIYIIPWRILFSNHYFLANSLYVQGYNVYATLLVIAIAGIPSAIAKEVAHYNALNEYGIGVKLYKKGLKLSVSIGFICAVLFYLCAPLLDNDDARLIPVMHSLAWAILIIPSMSITRGFFQGYQDMAPSAISQFAEQLIRVIYMLIATYLILDVTHGSWLTAVSQSTFAAFIGSCSGFLILGWYYLRRHSYYKSLVKNSNHKMKVPTMHLYHEIIQQAVPFVILGAGTSIFQLIDQYTFFKAMNDFTSDSSGELNALYAIFAGNAGKLIMVPISLASSIAITIVPLLSKAYTHKNKQEINYQIRNALVLFEMVMIPSALGMAAVAGPLNRVFYGVGHQALAANVLSVYSIISITFGLFTVVSAMMQGISQNKRAVGMFCIGTLAKIIVQYPCIYFFGVFGPMISSAIGFIVTSGLIINYMNRRFGIKYSQISNVTNQITICSLVVYFEALLLVHVFNILLGKVMNIDSSLGSLAVLMLVVSICALTFVYLALSKHLADWIIGKKMSDKLRKNLGIELPDINKVEK